jgi:hypothetical protein
MGASIKKPLFFILVLGLSVSLMSPQSLVELAKKEKARRASLRIDGKKRIIATNKDLKKFELHTAESAFIIVPQEQSLIQASQKSIPAPKIKVSIESQRGQSDRRFGISRYAAKILPSSRFADGSEAALAGPNGQFVEISLFGFLDVEVEAKNGPGDDIAVYARLAGAEEARRVSLEGGFPLDAGVFGYTEGFWYGVLCLTDKGEWVALGRGTGAASPETFDLGGVPSTKRLRIMFKPHSNADFPVRYRRINPSEFTFGIDAVEILH